VRLGRLIAIAIMVTGIGFVAFLTAYAADRFIRYEVQEDAEASEKRVIERLDQIDPRLQRLERNLNADQRTGARDD